MTRRSLNLVQFWLTLAFFFVPPVAFTLAGYFRFISRHFPDAAIDPRSYVALIVAATVAWALFAEHFRLNRVESLSVFQTGILTIGKATACTMMLVLGIVFFYRSVAFSRLFIVLGCSLMFLISLLVLHSFRSGLLIRHNLPIGRLRIAIVGDDEYAVQVAQQLKANSLIPCDVACFVTPPIQNGNGTLLGALPWERLEDAVDTFHCQELLVALPISRFADLRQVLERAQYLCVPVRVVLNLGAGIYAPDQVFSFNGLPLLDIHPSPVDMVRYAIAKRAFDVAFSSLVLLCTAPLTALIALAIKLTSPGPVFFAQERVGLNGERFNMLKFRTMRIQDSACSNTRHTSRNDTRITYVGRMLRQTSLDELPQFFNVLKGDMSVVGPRPELTFFVQRFRTEIPAYMARHNIKCGITGWAQINGLRGSDTSIAKRIEYDLNYMRNWSMALDLKIIFLTVFNGLLSRNAY